MENTYVKKSLYSVEELTKMGVTANARSVYDYLLERANTKQGTCFPSLNNIAEACGIKTRETVSKIIKLLVKVGLILKRKRPPLEKGGHTSNEYRVRELTESKKSTEGVEKSDSNKCSHEVFKKRDFQNWEYKPEHREFFEKETGVTDFAVFKALIEKFKKFVETKYVGNKYDELFFETFVANEIKLINAKKKKEAKAVTKKPSVDANKLAETLSQVAFDGIKQTVWDTLKEQGTSVSVWGHTLARVMQDATVYIESNVLFIDSSSKQVSLVRVDLNNDADVLCSALNVSKVRIK